MIRHNEKEVTIANEFLISWKVPIKKEIKDCVIKYFDSIDYTKFNFIALEICGAEDMTLNEATEIIKYCQNDNVYCSLSVVVDNKNQFGYRRLDVKCSYKQDISKGSSIKLIKEDKVIEI